MLEAAILVGGASTRMGHDKSLISIDGRPAAIHIHEMLTNLGFDRVLLVGGDGDRFDGFDVQHLPDTRPAQGPLGGILTALNDVRSEWALILAVDLPRIGPSDIERMMLARDEHRFDDVVHATSDEGPQPLFGWWRRSVVQTIDRSLLEDRRSVRALLGSLRVSTIQFESSSLLNTNRPEDLG